MLKGFRVGGGGGGGGEVAALLACMPILGLRGFRDL